MQKQKIDDLQTECAEIKESVFPIMLASATISPMLFCGNPDVWWIGFWGSCLYCFARDPIKKMSRKLRE